MINGSIDRSKGSHQRASDTARLAALCISHMTAKLNDDWYRRQPAFDTFDKTKGISNVLPVHI